MKYIRTKYGIYEDAGTDAGGWRCVRYKDFKIALSQDDDKTVKEADTIEELCDAFILLNEDNGRRKICLPYEIGLRARIYEGLGAVHQKIYGAIWIVGEHNEPILKSVAEMNEKGEMVLL